MNRNAQMIGVRATSLSQGSLIVETSHETHYAVKRGCIRFGIDERTKVKVNPSHPCETIQRN